jgi:hypothetical protein
MTSKNPWFVKPDVSRINLKWNDPDGHTHPLWIEVKTELTIGEERSILRSVSNVTAEVQQKTATTQRQDPSANFDWTEYSFARMLTYLLDWSLADENNNKLAINRDVLGSFHKTLFDLIDDAVEQHISAGGETKKQKGTKRKR